MKKFYTSAESGIGHTEGIGVVKAAIVAFEERPLLLLRSSHCCFEGAAIVAFEERLKEPRSVLTASRDLLGGKLDVEGDTAFQGCCSNQPTWGLSAAT